MFRTFRLLFALPLALTCVNAAPAQAQAPLKVEEELVDKVRKCIDLGVKYLISQQNRDGNWEGVILKVIADLDGGQTALVTLALLNSGMKPDDPVLTKTFKYLRALEPKKTYVVALQNLVFAEARERKDLPLIQRNAEWLVSNAIGYNNGAGRLEGWSYPGNQMGDNSNTQYALLGLYAAKQAGVKIRDEEKVWKAIQEYYVRTQISESATSGKWSYLTQIKDLGTISMTVAGVCGLIIAGMGLDESEQKLDPSTGIAANCGAYSTNTPVAKGMNWIGAHFTFESQKSMFYNVYGIERLGRLSGQRFIDRYDWYREGCEKLIRMQEDSGASKGAIVAPPGNGVDNSRILSTSFALLFLSKGRTPVLISKFAWGEMKTFGNGTFVEVPTGPEGQVNWNRKHNDTRHVVEFCSRELFNGIPLSWQVYDVRRKDFGNDPGGKSGKEKILEEVGSLLQSPVLYLNGHGSLVLTSAQEEILKTYLEEGGFLVAEACCGDRVFAASLRGLMQRLFPDNQLRRMPPEHAIWKMFPGITPLDFPDIESLDRGCRTVCVFSPTPVAGYWEEQKYAPKDGKNPVNTGEKAYCLARNIVAYATGMELPKPKLSFQRVEQSGKNEVGVTRSHFKAAQLKLSGDPEPAPDALKNLMSYLRDNARLEVAKNSAVLAPYDDQLIRFKFNYMHGRKPFTFSEDELSNVKANLQTGGLLLADAACGGYEQWKAFDKSFREMCAKMFPDHKLVVIEDKAEDGKDEAFFKIAREAGINLKNVRCRRELGNGKGPEPEMRNYPVFLEGIKVDGRWVVIYSKYDIGCAIEGHKAADCLGYDKDSALRIASAVVLYSLKR
jgi:hypothetical protein